MAVDSFPPATRPDLAVVSGPTGSGKSRWAEHLAETSGLEVVYLATGPSLPDQPSWQRRIERHRRRRPPHWHCREVGGDLAPALDRLEPGQIGLVDSLGTWVAAHVDVEPMEWDQRWDDLQAAIDQRPIPLILVCEEVGWGVVPPTRVGGRFRDRLAAVQLRLTAQSDTAWLVLQGRAIDLHACSVPVPAGPNGWAPNAAP